MKIKCFGMCLSPINIHCILDEKLPQTYIFVCAILNTSEKNKGTIFLSGVGHEFNSTSDNLLR